MFVDAYSSAKFLFEQALYPVPGIEIISQNGKNKIHYFYSSILIVVVFRL